LLFGEERVGLSLAEKKAKISPLFVALSCQINEVILKAIFHKERRKHHKRKCHVYSDDERIIGRKFLQHESVLKKTQ